MTWDHPSFASAVRARTSLRRLADVLVRIQIGQGRVGGDFVVCAKAGTAKKAAATAALTPGLREFASMAELSLNEYT